MKIAIMTFNLLFLLVVPTFVYGNININIVVSENRASSKVQYSGEDKAFLSPQEELTFQVYEESLKSAVGKYFGKRPDDVYLRENTPWNLYSKYGWKQVQRVLKPVAARIIRVSTTPVIVLREKLQNHGDKQGLFYIDTYQELANTIGTSWFRGADLTVEREITTGVLVTGKTTHFMQFTSSWGKTDTKSKTTRIRVTSGTEVMLRPNEVVNVDLTASQGIMEVEVDYIGTLEGDVAANYGKPYKGHHFWGLDVQSIQEAAGLPTNVTATAKLQIKFYTEANIRNN